MGLNIKKGFYCHRDYERVFTKSTPNLLVKLKNKKVRREPPTRIKFDKIFYH